MAKTFLEYFKTVLPNFSFDIYLLEKEYHKALSLLNPKEGVILKNWLNKKGIQLSPIKLIK